MADHKHNEDIRERLRIRDINKITKKLSTGMAKTFGKNA
jgi:hypothetical protein